MDKLEPGYYWACYAGEWDIAYHQGNMWLFALYDEYILTDELDEIDPRPIRREERHG